MSFGPPCNGRHMPSNLICRTRIKCTLYTMSSSVLQLGKTSSARFRTKINNIKLIIYSDKFKLLRSSQCVPIFLFFVAHTLQELSHILTMYKEITFYKLVLLKKIFFLLFVSCLYSEYLSKFKESYGLFTILKFTKTVYGLLVTPKFMKEAFKFLLDLGLISSPSVKPNYSIKHYVKSKFHENLETNAKTYFKILSNFELVLSVKKESTHLVSFFTITLQTYNII